MRGDKTRNKILAMEGVSDVWNEGQDGWWITTKMGWKQGDNDCHSWSGPDLGQLLKDARDLARCECDRCQIAKREN